MLCVMCWPQGHLDNKGLKYDMESCLVYGTCPSDTDSKARASATDNARNDAVKEMFSR